MVVINAVGVSEGFAEGTLICRKISNHKNIPIRRENFESELQRYAQAKSKAQIKLKEMYESMLELCGKSEAELFIAYQMMLEDDDYQNGILELIESKHMS
ncbi:MAG: phosphoenolpyruvate-utilizing N-terminal domain-containing protein, partial [Acutalibacteraceae bacterium]